ncbi:uracil-DNA glycosylase [Thalassobacillus hwangdonensis]|uniref:Uracil-DNA glycosylase n=1 Tax=Thalassobacillus hwangdonensis TaxID=546108 RepID=A0ABW3KZA0_9BACI
MSILHNDWQTVLQDEFEQDYYRNLREFLVEEYNHYTIHPDMDDIFNALHVTQYKDTKVVILGQDPYHGHGQAHGFSFSVQTGVAIPPSLKNIYKELYDDIGIEPPNHGNLACWAEQGVLLLNNVLTVRHKQAHSHQGAGWEKFTDRVIDRLNARKDPVVFILWGKPAQKKAAKVDDSIHYVIKSPHPSPLSAYRGFYGSKPFSRANDFLKAHGIQPIDWKIPNE